MKTSPNGIKFIASHEGEVLRVYLDPVGLATLGVGHLLSKAELAEMAVGTKITKEQSREYLAKDLARFERAITAAVKVPLSQNQFDALVSFSFNVGESAFRRSSCLRKLNERNYVGAADALLAWNKAGGRVLPGLVRRRKEERALFLTPSAAVTPATNPDGQKPTDLHNKGNDLSEGQPPIASDITETKTTEVAQAGGMTTAVEQTTPGGDAPDVPPTFVSKNGPLSKWLASGGLLGIGAFVWNYIQSNPSAVAIGIICVTALIVAIIFRGAITDAVRMTAAADPTKKNVS